MIPSDNIALGGTAAHTIQPNPANWTVSMHVMDGALALDAFAGTTASNASVNTIRFFNSSYVGTAPGASTVEHLRHCSRSRAARSCRPRMRATT